MSATQSITSSRSSDIVTNVSVSATGGSASGREGGGAGPASGAGFLVSSSRLAITGCSSNKRKKSSREIRNKWQVSLETCEHSSKVICVSMPGLRGQVNGYMA